MPEESQICPSAQPEMVGAQVLGVVERGGPAPQVSYVNATVPVTEPLLAATGDVPPTLVYRFAAPCAEKKCSHFDGAKCQLAVRIAAELTPVVEKLPPCAIRKSCRWYLQEEAAACARCPQVVTHLADRDDPMVRVAHPDGPPHAVAAE